jgi:hypothetical protein
VNARKPPKAAWDMVCLPKDEVAYESSEHIIQGCPFAVSFWEAMMKNLHKFVNGLDIPWVNLI